MIVLAQRANGTVVEALAIVKATDWNAWELGVIVFDTAKGETLEVPNGEASRFLGAGDLVVTMRGAVSELAQWALPVDSLEGFLNRIDALCQLARDRLEAAGPPAGVGA